MDQDKLDELMALPLSGINSVTLADHELALKFINKNSDELFRKEEGDISPFEYLTNRLVSKHIEMKKHGEVKWEYIFRSFRCHPDDIRMFSFATACWKDQTRVWGETHMLGVLDEAFTMLLVPYFASGFSEHFVKSIKEDQEASPKQ